MSHFTVAVITEGKPTHEKIKAALAPYQENNMGDCPRQYLEFHSYSKKYKEEYEMGTTERVRLKDGTLVYTWSDELYREVSKEEYEEAKANGKQTSSCSYPEKYKVKYDLDEIGAELVTIPWKELYSTFEKYLEDWHDEKKMKKPSITVIGKTPTPNGIGIKSAADGQVVSKSLLIVKIVELAQNLGVVEMTTHIDRQTDIRKLIAQELKTLYFPIIKQITRKPRDLGN